MRVVKKSESLFVELRVSTSVSANTDLSARKKLQNVNKISLRRKSIPYIFNFVFMA